jgi:mannose-1-phosphate guanylyltransferase
MLMRYSMIMAGGAGTRLWPSSREQRPKQLLRLFDGRSLLELADKRLQGMLEPEQRYICTAEKFRRQIKAVLPHYDDERLLGEPAVRDTVNAIGLCAAVLQQRDADAVFAVLTADHMIRPDDAFQQALDTGFRLVEDDPQRLVTFAITPSYPATAYGYVERGERIDGFDNGFVAKQFREKPDEETAKKYIESGKFGWNSGMFIFSAATFMNCLERFKKESYDGLTQIAESWHTDRRQDVLNEVYPQLPKISVDYAVMEPAGDADDLLVAIVDMPVEWLDVGSWPTFAQTLEPDDAGNRIYCPTDPTLIDVKDSIVVSEVPGHTIAMVGCEELIVVHTGDATLICPVSEAQRVKDLAQSVPEHLR